MTKDQEVELKLETDPASIDALAHSSMLAVVDVEEQDQTSIYFDTPELDIHKAGLSLRIRKIGSKRIQTVKVESKTMVGLFARPEWEIEISRDQPVIDDHHMPLRTLVPDLQLEKLSAIFRIVVTRQKRSIMQDGAQVELVLDRGEILAGGAVQPISEVELELKAGSPVILFSLARTLYGLIPLELSTLSKAQRGYDLLARVNNRSIKFQASLLTPDLTSTKGFQAIAYACLHHFRLNQSILLSSEYPEALHQTRVALRRLRSALSIFRDTLAGDRFDHFQSELRWIAGELDMARDIDVLLAGSRNKNVRAKLLVVHRQAYADAKAALTSPRLRILVLDLVEWITIGDWLISPAYQTRNARPLDAFAADALDRCRRNMKRRGRHWAHLDDEGRHKLRIKVKKLRYSAEFFGALFPGKKATRHREDFQSDLEALQGFLGDLHDQTTGAAVLAKFGIPDASEHRAHFKQLLDKAEKAYKLLSDAKQFWR